MTENNASPFRHRKALGTRGLTLLASVAGLGVAMLVAGPGGYLPKSFPAWTSSARAAESIQHPAGFADLVTNVKPAVISVRVKVDKSARRRA